MSKVADTIYLVLNTILIIVGLTCLFFISFFYLGSKEQHDEAIHLSGWSFFLARFLFNAPLILLCMGLLLLLTRIAGKRISTGLSIKRILLIDALILIVGSIMFVYIAHFG